MYLSTIVGSLNEVYLTRVNTVTEITFQLNCWQGRWFHSADSSRLFTLAFLLLIAFFIHKKSRFLDMTTHSHIAFDSKSCCTTIPCVLCCFFWREMVESQSVHHHGWHPLVEDCARYMEWHHIEQWKLKCHTVHLIIMWGSSAVTHIDMRDWMATVY